MSGSQVAARASLIGFLQQHPEAWDAIIPQTPLTIMMVDPRVLSAEARQELRAQLGDIHTAVMSKVREGDVVAAGLAANLAIQRAALG